MPNKDKSILKFDESELREMLHDYLEEKRVTENVRCYIFGVINLLKVRWEKEKS